ncbi:hypothetical protein Cni_G22896 [Canna indica]|uniref:Neutral/alkaline non-lysosomal ceramidase N-terminal domain-containing protein n=1 Tax=Canna indica TaxID=4628 RepID=A0AAQ3QLZ7_9LILI|nr:hypothetical protein Cni_G22896 [Canna indica]
MYNEKNVAISGIHTHAGPGGYLQYFNWYATHGTSMSRTNSLITGDNKGATAHFMEDWAEQKGYPKGGDSIYPGIATAIRDNRVHRRVPIIIPQPHENSSEQVKGKIDYSQTILDFSQLEVTLDSSDGGQEVVKTCPAAMGFAFAVGTTDGPGAFDFKQGTSRLIVQILACY